MTGLLWPVKLYEMFAVMFELVGNYCQRLHYKKKWLSCFDTLRTLYYQDVIFMASITPARIAHRI